MTHDNARLHRNVGLSRTDLGEARRRSTMPRSAGRQSTCAGAVIVAAMAAAVIAPIFNACPADPLTGGGELRVDGDIRTTMLAPTLYREGMAEIEGNISGPLIWWGGCGKMLNCERCPPTLVEGFNASVLQGAILVYDDMENEQIGMCGHNNIARGLGGTGLAALANVHIMDSENPLPFLFRASSLRLAPRSAHALVLGVQSRARVGGFTKQT